jgi:hypothetical protein
MFAFSSRWIYLTSHQAKWQPICILITVLCLQSTDNELSHIVCWDIFAARNLFSLGVFPKPMEMVSEQLVQFKQELHKQSACQLSMILVWKTLFQYLLINDCWMANHIDQFFYDWWRWISAVEEWSCRRDWFNSKVLSLSWVFRSLNTNQKKTT